MNAAFHRGHAVTALEELSLIIVIHCVLVANFPENEAVQHWEAELSGFSKTLRRLNRGKKGRTNFTKDLMHDVLLEIVRDEEEQETIETHIAAKDIASDEINWITAEQKIREFCDTVLA